MLHIIFLILKVIGILILAVLGLLLLILCLVAFVPIRYRADAGKDAQIYAKAHIHWLLHLVSVRISYGKNGVRIGFCIFGRDLLSRQESEGTFFDESPDDKDESPDDKDEAPRKSAEDREEESDDSGTGPDFTAEVIQQSPPAYIQEELKTDDGPGQPAIEEVPEELQIDAANEEPSEELQPASERDPSVTDKSDPKPKIPLKQRLSAAAGKVNAVKRKIKASVRGIRRSLSNIRNTAHKLKRRLDRFLDFWNANATQSSIRHVLKEVKYILRHIRPRKFEGDVRFGFEDPATTGKILGYLSVLSGFTGNRFTAEADFEQTCFEGEAYLTGHIRLCHIIRAGIVLLLDKNIWKTLKAFKKLTR